MQNQNPIHGQYPFSNGSVLGDAFQETQLSMRLFQGPQEITEQYNNFRWERMSNDRESDEVFNQLLEVPRHQALLRCLIVILLNNQSVVARAFMLQEL